MTMVMEDRLLMQRLDEVERKVNEVKRELEAIRTFQVIRLWKRRGSNSKKV